MRVGDFGVKESLPATAKMATVVSIESVHVGARKRLTFRSSIPTINFSPVCVTKEICDHVERCDCLMECLNILRVPFHCQILSLILLVGRE